MENVHKTSKRPWISKKMSVRKIQDVWKNLLESKTEECKNLKDLISAEEYASVEKECSPAALRCAYQQFIEISAESTIPDDINLETVRLQQEDLDMRKNDNHYATVVYNHSKLYNYPLYQKGQSSDFSKADFKEIKQPNVVLTVQIYRPEIKLIGQCSSRPPTFNVDQEFMVLGSQYLTELRDVIECVSDHTIPGDLSENPFSPPNFTCKDLYKSGFFYIDGIFYNDMRHPDCKDYSDIIVKWSQNPSRGIGPFHKLQMEHSKFIDLDIQLGYPYVYVHQGNCEHFLVFSDIAYFGSCHKKNRNDYPLHISLKPKKRELCMVCHRHVTEWIVCNNKRLPETPFYFCKACFFGFNYDEKNKKIGEFEAYHYVDRSTIT